MTKGKQTRRAVATERPTMRATAFRAQPPALVAKRIERALSCRMCLVQELGPTRFVVRPMAGADPSAASDGVLETPPDPSAESRTYKVSVGDNQMCTCGDKELCIHILFVMLKVFRVEVGNPLIWQKSLLDTEISKIISDRERFQSRQAAPQVPPTVAVTAKYVPFSTLSCCCHFSPISVNRAAPQERRVTRKPLVAGETCPICMDDMTVDEALSWCKYSCGSSVHNKCMRVWAEHKCTSGDKVTCPLCRQEWRPEQVRPLVFADASFSKRACACGRMCLRHCGKKLLLRRALRNPVRSAASPPPAQHLAIRSFTLSHPAPHVERHRCMETFIVASFARYAHGLYCW